ncbi:MAG: site-specific integrase [Actinobacteria bacterium]|nr:site-specific integrase [Actinomycetota bacterium]MCL5882721.1 site-specific integrase [Actinomycetota bacterium]
MKGHVKKRGGTWTIIYDLGRDIDGKRQQKWKGGFRTKKEADAELNKILHELNSGAYTEPSRVSVAGYMRKWLKEYAKHNVTGRTYVRYEEIVEKHLIPALGRNVLPELRPAQISAYYSEALSNGRLNGKGGLSAKTVRQHHAVLRKALEQAVQWQMINRNPAAAVAAPKPKQREMTALNDDQLAELLHAVEGTQNYIPILLAATTGMRRGEIFGLKWHDVDLEKPEPILHVSRAVQVVNGQVSLKEPKTQKGRRGIVLYPLTVMALKKHRIEQNENRLKLGSSYQDNDLICARTDGTPVNVDTFSKTFAQIIRKTGLPVCRLHDLRHSHATSLLAQNTNPKIVSERLGHANINITLDTYSHVLPGLQEEAVLKVNDSLSSAMQRLGKSNS